MIVVRMITVLGKKEDSQQRINYCLFVCNQLILCCLKPEQFSENYLLNYLWKEGRNL